MDGDTKMDIGIFTLAYNGYGKFALRWAKSISESTVAPAQATLALFGRRHGLTYKMRRECLRVLPCLKIVHCGDHVNIGHNRNMAAANTNTEWLMLVSVDDILLPAALEEIAKRDSPDVDVIAVAYTEEKLDGKDRYWPVPQTFEKGAMLNWRDYWLAPYSPFRRSFWEEHPYENCEFPNYLQTFQFARSGTRFAKVDKPCVKYIRRIASHSKRRTRSESEAIEAFLDKHAETNEREAIKYRLDRLKGSKEGKIVTDIYQERYLAHQEAKKNRVVVDPKPTYTDKEIMTMFKIMHERRSQRIFNGERIGTDRLSGIFKAASLAPSSCNRKAISIKRISSPQGKLLLSELLVGGAGWIDRADTILLLLADLTAYKAPGEVEYMPFLDAGVIAENVYLAGEALGIGICMVNPNVRDANKEKFNSLFVPAGYQFCCAIALGCYEMREAKKEYEVNELWDE